MNYKDRMKVAVSQAEEEVLLELSRRSLHPESQKTVCLHHCIPDFYFPPRDWERHKGLCIFIDGPPHAKPKRIDRDNGIDELLRKRGFKVARFGYKGKLSKERLKQICDEIQELVK